MFSYQGDGVVLQQIVNKTNVAESKLGLSVSDIDMSLVNDDGGEGDEDAAMKELEAIITKGESQGKGNAQKDGKKLSPVQAILANAGVSYTHENSEVVGTSKTELRISRKAAEAATTTHEVANRPVFDGDNTNERDDTVTYQFNPPEEVRKRQFCTMARMLGFRDAVEFALVVEGWTQMQRQNCLDRFYRLRREVLLEKGRGKVHTPVMGLEEAGGEEVGAEKPGAASEVVAVGEDVDVDYETTDDEL
jgi:hypothetical protein